MIQHSPEGEDDMHRSGEGELVRCADCGVETAPEAERGYFVSADLLLCFACARRRGGHWDEEKARWSGEPDLSGLPVRDSERR